MTKRSELNQDGIDLFRRQYNPHASQQSSEFLNNWKPLPDSQNAFHNFTADGTKIMDKRNDKYPNTKYVHTNGQFEVIIDSKGNIVTDPTNAGTYNYYPSSGYYIMRSDKLHTEYDIHPCWILVTEMATRQPIILVIIIYLALLLVSYQIIADIQIIQIGLYLIQVEKMQ